MIDKRIAIGALARNCEENLPGNIDRIEELRKHFASSCVFIYENNSTDSTKDILKKWQSKSDNIYLRLEDIDESKYRLTRKERLLYRGTSSQRIKKMCDCRNKLLNMINQGVDTDYVVFIDVDIKWFSVDGIINSIENAPKDWGGIFSNCYVSFLTNQGIFDLPEYYDTFAYLDYGREADEIELKELNRLKRHHIADVIYKKVNSTGYLQCVSAFGGVGLYKRCAIEGLKYNTYSPIKWNDTSSSLCEHILYNSKVKGACYVARDLRVTYFLVKKNRFEQFLLRNCPHFYSFVGMLKELILG